MTDTEQKETQQGARIAKVISRAGLCSRREAERWIADGRVAVNGVTLDSPACVVTENDTVTVDGNPLPDKQEQRMWRYHKPTGLITSHKDPEGRDTVFDKLPKDLPRVISVGRLDINSEGLLLLTNDGALPRSLELPSRGWSRRYRVRVNGKVNEDKLKSLKKGIEIDGIKYGSIDAQLDKVQGHNAWLTVAITEGKNREIRRVMESMDLRVSRLIRLSYGPFQLGTLEAGAVEEIRRKTLRDQLGLKLSGQAPAGHAKPKKKVKSKGPRPGSKPRQKPGVKSGPNAGPKTAPRSGGKPENRGGGKPDNRTGGKPGNRPNNRSGSKAAGHPSSKSRRGNK